MTHENIKHKFLFDRSILFCGKKKKFKNLKKKAKNIPDMFTIKMLILLLKKYLYFNKENQIFTFHSDRISWVDLDLKVIFETMETYKIN